MTLVYEPVCHGSEHAPFNAALLATILEAFAGEEVSFYAEPSHLAAVRALLGQQTAPLVGWKPIAIAARVSADSWLRARQEWRTVSAVLAEARACGATRMIACATTSSGLAALKAQLLLTRPPNQVAVMHHSGLVSLMASRSTRALLALANGAHLRHVVLGRNIRRTLMARLPALAPDIVSIRHPYLFPETLRLSTWPEDHIVRFGFLGLASADKGFDRFCRLASRLRSESSSTSARARFELVGRLGDEYRVRPPADTRFDAVTLEPRDQPIPRTHYEQRVSALTYAVLPYVTEHYALVSSGAILDAFAHATPCIALRNPLFEEYFSAMGDIGYLCDTEEELVDVARSVVTNQPKDRYASQRAAILKGREMFSPASVAQELRAVMAMRRAMERFGCLSAQEVRRSEASSQNPCTVRSADRSQ